MQEQENRKKEGIFTFKGQVEEILRTNRGESSFSDAQEAAPAPFCPHPYPADLNTLAAVTGCAVWEARNPRPLWEAHVKNTGSGSRGVQGQRPQIRPRFTQSGTEAEEQELAVGTWGLIHSIYTDLPLLTPNPQSISLLPPTPAITSNLYVCVPAPLAGRGSTTARGIRRLCPASACQTGVSMPFSQISPPSPSPTESIRLIYTSVSLLLSRIQGYCCHLSKFHIYALVYCIGVFLSGLLHSV